MIWLIIYHWFYLTHSSSLYVIHILILYRCNFDLWKANAFWLFYYTFFSQRNLTHTLALKFLEFPLWDFSLQSCFGIGLFQKKFKRRRGVEDKLFWKKKTKTKTLEYLDLLLYPYKSRKKLKQAFTTGKFAKLCDTPLWKLQPKVKNQDPLKFHEFF